MCGICGMAIPATSRRHLDEPLLVRMRDTLVHRGPDDSGLFLAPGVGLGMRRLSIVDLAHGHQPMASADGRFTIVMPHPERVFRTVQMSWAPPRLGEDSPWMRMFRNARKWVG